MNVLLAFLANTIVNFVIGLTVAKFLGPEEYGRFALAFSIAAVVQVALFDWLRLAGTRFYSERVRENEPVVRATLDASFIVVAAFLAGATALYVLVGPTLDFEGALILLALVLAAANGLFDYSAALLRARFEDRLYSRLVFVKNMLALGLIGCGVFLFHSAGVALAATVASLVGTVIVARGSLKDPGAGMRAASRDTARSLIAYGAPIVAAQLLYQAIPLAARSIVASAYGFAEVGQFSLAYDLGIRAVQSLGSALDVLLFPIAVNAHEEHGDERSREQLAHNLNVVIAFLMPACTGVWLVMPSIEHLIVPAQFRGPFGHYLSLLLPGLFAMALIMYGVNPVFQIAKRTGPLIAAALCAIAAGFVFLLALPWGADASSLALAQCGAYLAALAATLVFAARAKPVWPPFWDMFAAAAATVVMALALSPLRAMTPGLGALLVQVAAGVSIYGALALLFDIAGLRAMALHALRPILERR